MKGDLDPRFWGHSPTRWNRLHANIIHKLMKRQGQPGRWEIFTAYVRYYLWKLQVFM